MDVEKVEQMGVPVQDFLTNRRNRCVGSILGNAERAAWFKDLSSQEREDLRKLVRDAVGSYHDSVLDLVRAEDGVMRNDEVVALLERIEQTIDQRRARPIVTSVLQTGV